MSNEAELYEAHGYTRWADIPQRPPHPVSRTIGGSDQWNSPAIQVRPLRWHADARGGLVEIHRRSWHHDMRLQEHRSTPGEVAQVYVSTTAEGVVKGWHLHAKQTDRFTVLRGAVVLALYDVRAHDRACATWQPLPSVVEVMLHAERNPSQVVVPPGWAHGWMALHGYGEAHVLNAVSEEYDGTDEFRRDAHAGPCAGVQYEWRRSRDG
jgi:dTDP-4-dehydrorhamnose 3,5-epimerase